MLHRGLRLCTLSSPPAKPTISRKGLGWKMFSAECRNTNWAKRTSRIFSLGTGHLPNAKVTRTDINLTQIRMQLTPHPCQLHLTLSICTSSDAYPTRAGMRVLRPLPSINGWATFISTYLSAISSKDVSGIFSICSAHH